MRTVALLAATMLLASPVAHAEDPTAAARDHYNRGSTLYDLGRFGEAAREFEAAYEAKNNDALLYNIGQAYRADGNYQKALVAYRAFLRKSSDGTHRAEVEARISELEKLLEEQKKASPRPPTETIPAPAPTVHHETPPTASSLVATATPAPPERTPVYKKWWLWTVVGVVAAGAATGVAVALTTPKDASIPANATQVSFH